MKGNNAATKDEYVNEFAFDGQTMDAAKQEILFDSLRLPVREQSIHLIAGTGKVFDIF